jgi:uncharacterized membrane protein YvbJ
MGPLIICRHCNTNVSETDFFCPNCGKKLKEKPLSTSIVSQILIYSLSIFLPPLGLWPDLKQPDQKSKNIGIVALVLTIVISLITIYLCISILDSFTTEFTNQMKLYKDLNL